MNIKRALAVAIAAIFALAIGVPAAHADAQNQLSMISINQPIQIPTPSSPGHMTVLPAGTYVFKMAPIFSNRKIVQIYNAKQTKLYATINTISTKYVVWNPRDLATRTMLTFAEGPKGTPLTLVKWYYVDNNIGHEFTYTGPMEKKLSHEEKINVEAEPSNFAPNPALTYDL